MSTDGLVITKLLSAICFNHEKSGLRISVWHYTAYVKRSIFRKWELFDGMKKNPILVKDITIIMCEFLVYIV